MSGVIFWFFLVTGIAALFEGFACAALGLSLYPGVDPAPAEKAALGLTAIVLVAVGTVLTIIGVRLP